jgi:PTS system nitrogen regulatory IIA component
MAAETTNRYLLTMNLSQLSKYLHLPEEQVRKLAENGAIPSRKVNGEYKFAREEVHHWLEERIGVSDEQELTRIERTLDATVPVGEAEESVSIASLIPAGAITVPLAAKTRDSVIRSMVKIAEETGLLWDAAEMTEAVKQREELHSTALDNGVALLHSRRPLPNILGDTFIVVGIVPAGVYFGGGMDNKTDIFILICSTDDRIHLRILTRVSRILTAPKFLETLRTLDNEEDIRRFIRESESQIR